jgi:hypothetical protein
MHLFGVHMVLCKPDTAGMLSVRQRGGDCRKQNKDQCRQHHTFFRFFNVRKSSGVMAWPAWRSTSETGSP